MFATSLVLFIHGIQFVNILNKFNVSQKAKVEINQHLKGEKNW